MHGGAVHMRVGQCASRAPVGLALGRIDTGSHGGGFTCPGGLTGEHVAAIPKVFRLRLIIRLAPNCTRTCTHLLQAVVVVDATNIDSFRTQGADHVKSKNNMFRHVKPVAASFFHYCRR